MSKVFRHVQVWIEEMRPSHILKSSFLYLPILFGGAFFCQEKFFPVTTAAILFYLISIPVYLFNDIMDFPEDRLRPERKDRPVASGRIGRKSAAVAAGILATAVLWFSHITCGYIFALILLLYVLLNVFYSLCGKKAVPLDLFLLAIFFELRTIAGSVVSGVPASHWLLTLVMLLSLLLSLGKHGSRKNYSLTFTRNGVLFLSGSIFILYTVYVFGLRTERNDTSFAWLTIFPCLYGILSYLKLCFEEESALDPVPLLLKNRHLQFACILFIILSFISLHASHETLSKIFFFVQ